MYLSIFSAAFFAFVNIQVSTSAVCEENEGGPAGLYVFCSFSNITEITENCQQLQNRTDVKRIGIEIWDKTIVNFNLATCFPPNANRMTIVSPYVTEISLDPVKMINLISLTFNCKLLTSIPDQIESLTNLETLHVSSVDWESSSWSSPASIKEITIWVTPMQTMPCQFLKSLTDLTGLYIIFNKNLKSFDLRCVPANVKWLDLHSNSLMHIDMSPILNSLTQLNILRISGNPFNCSCSLFNQWVEILKLENLSVRKGNENLFITCGSGPLSGYPLWNTTDVAYLINYDKANLNCLSHPESATTTSFALQTTDSSLKLTDYSLQPTDSSIKPTVSSSQPTNSSHQPAVSTLKPTELSTKNVSFPTIYVVIAAVVFLVIFVIGGLFLWKYLRITAGNVNC